MYQLFKNTGKLTRFQLRQDRVRIPVWIISLSILTFATALAFVDLYQNDAERQAVAETMRNPAMTAMVGQGYGLDDYTVGAMMAHQMLLFTAITVAIMSILLVTRHTRTDEEDGRVEMIRALPSGRLSNLTSTIVFVSITNVVLALIIGFGNYALGIESMDLEGSLLYGAALGVTGIFFTAITAVFAQLSESSRGTIGLSFAVLGLTYLIRAIGDVGNETISWFSPLGWVLGTEVYVNNYWWPIVLTLGFSLILFVVAFILHAIRDMGSGFLPSRTGRRDASIFLQSPLGLAVRLQRTAIISWAVGMFAIGVSYGSVLGDLESFMAEIEIMEQMVSPVEGFSLTEQFITMLMAIMSMISTIPVIMIILKIKSEENKNRTEHLYSHPITRNRVLGNYFILSLAVSIVMQFLAIFGLWSAGSTVMDDGISFRTLFNAGMIYLPAIWIMIGAAVLLVGSAPKLSGLIWLYLIYSFIIVYLGDLLQLPEWLSKLSPFGHIPQIPVEEMDILVVIIVTIVAITLTVGGFIGYNRRDIKG
ncbi:ABC transporter permease [Oceanobacillus saliphilus]|uniref:ABC transporter permease n=1 Tax=Oceanobacillus saliphilus TaxID=2925834 RepID=UPI00201DC2F0|nr:ABC transporter permease [Oceanobacillus saliphilus]